MIKINTKKALFTLSGLGLIALLVMFGRTYNVHAAAKPGKTFGDWVVACEKEGKKDVCFLSQVLTSQIDNKDKKDKKDAKPQIQRVAEFRVGYFGGSKELRIIQILPFGTNLQAGTSIILAKDKLVAPGKFTTCQPFGCLAIADLTDVIDTIGDAKDETFVGIITIDGKQVNIPLSVKGLKDGVASLK